MYNGEKDDKVYDFHLERSRSCPPGPQVTTALQMVDWAYTRAPPEDVPWRGVVFPPRSRGSKLGQVYKAGKIATKHGL